MQIRIGIVDDKTAIRHSLERKLGSDTLRVVITAADGSDFLDKMKTIAPADRPQVVLMDIDMPVMNGIETVFTASRLYPATRFLMLTVFDDDEKIFSAVKSGASGYLLKEEEAPVICEAIRQVMEEGGAPMSPRIARKTLALLMQSEWVAPPAADDNAGPLSDREKAVLQLLVDGYNYKRIADELFISPNTVRNHMASIYKKLHVRSKVDAVKVGMKRKWF